MKQINKKHRWLACLLAFIMLIGVVEPLGVVKAETNIEIAELKITDAYANGTSQWAKYMLQFQSKTSVSTPEGTLVAVADSGEILRNGSTVVNKSSTQGIRLRVNTQGVFSLDQMEYTQRCDGAYNYPLVTETFTVKGQFNIVDSASETVGMVTLPTTTFQYMGTDSTSGYGYWRVYTETVESGAITLDSTSLDGTDSISWGRVLFTTSNGYCPAPSGLRQLVSEGGTIKEKSSSEGEFVDITSNVKLLAGSPDSSLKSKYIIEPGYPYTSGTIYTIEGKFITEDGFSVNFPKTAIKRENVDGTHKWSYYTDVRESGELALNSGFDASTVKFWPQNTADVTFNSNLVPVTGNGTILENGNDVSSNVVLATYTSGLHAIWGVSANVGTVITLEGEFALENDATIVVRYPKTVFKIVETSGGSKKWIQIRTDNYVESGTVTVHDNSASASEAPLHTQTIYFQTEDSSIPKNTSSAGWLRAEQGTILYNGTDITSSLKYGGNARFYSYSNGVYLIYLQRNAVDGTTVTLQGTFAMPDGSIGVDLQPVTFKYVLPEGAEVGYWVTEGMTFTSDKQWQVESAYEEEILKYEASIRLSKTATANGGVILGNYDNNGDTYTLGVDTNGAPYLKLKDGDNEVTYQFTSTDVRTGDWVKIAIVRDGSNVYYYENDGTEPKETLTEQDIVSVVPEAKAVIGGDYSTDNANYFKGTIRDVRLYADASGTQLIASYDMSSFKKSTKTISGNNEEKAYNATVTLRWIDTAPTIGDYAYSFAVVGDTQAINDKNGNKNNGPLAKIYDYICDNASAKKIKFVFGLGDITENDDASEWERAKTQIQKLDGVVPYNLNRGNHDSSAMMNQYFTYTDYKDKVSGAADKAIENTCQFLTVGQVDYLIFSLDFGPSDDVLNWAGSIIESHPNHNVIITTHSYLTRDRKYTNADNDVALVGAQNTGQDIWDELVSQHKNIVMVLSGHVYTNDIIVKEATGKYGNTIKEIVVNPQVADAMTDGGTGMVAMLYFSEDGKKVQVRYYSTVRNQYLADTNQFSMDLNVVQHVDAVTVEPYEYAKFITYRTEGNYTAPTKEGYLFAGWFTDEECKTPLMQGDAVDSTKTYYAKFVDKYAQVVKRQVTNGATVESEKLDLRLITTLDSLDYAEVGFRVTFGENPTKTATFQTVYRTLHGAGILYHPSIFSSASTYFATLTITNIPQSIIAQNITVGVQTFWTTYDGTTVESVTDVKNLLPTN